MHVVRRERCTCLLSECAVAAYSDRFAQFRRAASTSSGLRLQVYCTMVERSRRSGVRSTGRGSRRCQENVRILLTNDDGIRSEGLWAAARGLARAGDLTVMGTADDWSNGSSSIRHLIGSRIARYEEIPDDLSGSVEA